MHVFREVWIEDRGPAGFIFVRFGQRDALGDAAAHRLGGMEDRYGPRATLDHDLCARAHARHQTSKVVRCFRLGDMDHGLGHALIIYRA